jgi:hypothetical protein|tara:strand:- start:57 stop:947 length:891 start_codon:yes stop_codon:yes gene_type:complete
MPTSTFRKIHQINLGAYRPEATDDERRQARDEKLDLFRTLDLGVDAKGRQWIEDDGFTKAPDGKFSKGDYTIHPRPDSVFRRVLDGSSFFAEFEGLRRASTGGRYKWLPRDRDENVQLSLMNLGQHLDNMGHISRRGWYFPDNPLTVAGYAFVLRLVVAIVFGISQESFTLSMGDLLWATSFGVFLGIPATLYFRRSHRNADPDFPMIRPWHQTQMLDHEVSFYQSGRHDEWMHAEKVPIKLPPKLESRQTIETALSNELFKAYGQALDPSYVDGSYKETDGLPARTIVPPRKLRA